MLVKQFIKGPKLTVGILNDKPLEVGATDERFPADLPARLTEQVEQTCLAGHRVLKLLDYSRADFRLDTQGKLWLLELNSLPGLTETSLLPQSAAAVGINFVQLCESICQLAES